MLNFAQLSPSTPPWSSSRSRSAVGATDGKTYPFVGEKACRARLESSEELRIANAILMFTCRRLTSSSPARRSTRTGGG
jgi:hypothetical protein